jgi:hypothetical protein
MEAQVSEGPVVHGNHNDADYDGFLARVQARFLKNIEGGAVPLFESDDADLWGAYLGTFGPAPADGEAATPLRQYHTCHACRLFVERFGGLVTVDAAGTTAPAIWHEDDAPDAYKPAIAAMARLVRKAKVTGVFLSSDRVWGTPETGVWHHLALTPPAAILHKRATQTAGQAMAEKREDFKTVMHALNEFTQPHLELALTLLKTDALYRSEKVLSQAEWLHGLHVARAAAHGSAKANAVWRAIATAPAGFCHPRSSMIGTLLEDIAAGMEFSEVSRRFAAKMHPLAYQRPQAAPTAGAIAAAEKIMQQLGAAGSLARRFARLDEVQALWKPAPAKDAPAAEGVFGHLKPKGAEAAPSMTIPAQTMTWDKFQRTVLPTAERIEFRAPSVGAYTALVTAVNADAPPILQWDREDARNPVSWYFWNGGSSAASFGLVAGAFVPVDAVAFKPSMWNGGNEHQGQGVLFVLAGARESKMPGAALFPEILKAEFHGIRSVLEAYSRGASIEGMREPHAAGEMLTKGDKAWQATVRVWSGGKSLDYCLDRWD